HDHANPTTKRCLAATRIYWTTLSGSEQSPTDASGCDVRLGSWSDSVIRRCRLRCPVCRKADTAGRIMSARSGPARISLLEDRTCDEGEDGNSGHENQADHKRA